MMGTHNDLQDTFGPESTIESIINRLNELVLKGNYVFRGYNKQSELIPGIIRETDYREKEKALLMDFEKYGSYYFHASTPIDFMSCAQHFGIPTRLLDFTHNPFIALFFALFMPKETNCKEDEEYYYIQYADLNENYCVPYIPHVWSKSFIEKPIELMAEKAWRCIGNVQKTYNNTGNVNELIEEIKKEDKQECNIPSKQEAILFVDPNQANQRIVMQQGVFMFPYTLDKEKHIKIINDNSDYIMIHKDHRDALLDYLNVLGCNTFRLMPDLKSVCDAIKRKNTGKQMA